jgi:hypothetical protein
MASLFFYGYWSISALPLLIVSVCINYWIGLRVTPVATIPERVLRLRLIAVVHMDAAFSAVLRSGIRLDFLPTDGHWTVAANALAAQAAADAIAHDLP